MGVPEAQLVALTLRDEQLVAEGRVEGVCVGEGVPVPAPPLPLASTVVVTVRESTHAGLALPLPLRPAVPVPVGLVLGVMEAVLKEETLGGVEGVAQALYAALLLAVMTAVGVTRGDAVAPCARLAEAALLTVPPALLPLTVPVAAADMDGDSDALVEKDGEGEERGELLSLGVALAVPGSTVALPGAEVGDKWGDWEEDALPRAVRVSAGLPEPDRDMLGEGEVEGDASGLRDTLPLPLPEGLPMEDTVTPMLRLVLPEGAPLALGRGQRELLALAVPPPSCVRLAEAEDHALAEGGPEALAQRLLLPLPVAKLALAVALGATDTEGQGLEEGDEAAVRVPLSAEVMEGMEEWEGEGDMDGDTVGVKLMRALEEARAVALPPARLAEALPEVFVLALANVVGEALPQELREAPTDALPTPEAVTDALTTLLLVVLGQGVAESVTPREGVREALALQRVLGEALELLPPPKLPLGCALGVVPAEALAAPGLGVVVDVPAVGVSVLPPTGLPVTRELAVTALGLRVPAQAVRVPVGESDPCALPVGQAVGVAVPTPPPPPGLALLQEEEVALGAAGLALPSTVPEVETERLGVVLEEAQADSVAAG